MTFARSTLLILALLGVGCASDTPEVAEAGEKAVEVDTDTVAVGRALFDRQFAQVCRGSAGQPAAAEYVAEPGIHPFVTLMSDDGIEYRGTTAGSFPKNWRLAWPDLAQAELVVCTTRIEATPVEVCEGYQDDDSGAEWSVQTHDAVYDVVVRVARTGEIVGATKVDVPAGPCPMFSMYRERASQPQPTYPMPSAGAVEVFVRPFVRGE